MIGYKSEAFPIEKDKECVVRITKRLSLVTPAYPEPCSYVRLVMDGEVEVHLVRLDAAQAVADPEKNGAVRVEGEPRGKKMGWMKLSRGHQGLLPKNTAYQFRSARPGVIVLQTCKGELSVEKWAEICQSH